MMKVLAADEQVSKQLSGLYDEAEAINISDWVLESLTGKNRLQRSLDTSLFLSEAEQVKLEKYLVELMEYRPVQYVLGESYFYGMKLFVDERVLIPRPETEELADWIVKYAQQQIKQPVVIDIGTGSGCLALAVKKGIPDAMVYAADLSEGALAVASENAARLKLDVRFLKMDILDEHADSNLPQLDIIVSNPPYITLPEQESILPNVLRYEPHQALFVTNNDPLQFYKAIASFSDKYLKKNGSIFLELHRDFAVETMQYYVDHGWKTELKQDMQEQDRMLHCIKQV
jgi:release factor glutamine methyltransferase